MVRHARLLAAGTVICWGVFCAQTSHAQQTLASPRLGGYASNPPLDPIGAGGVGRPSLSPYTNLYIADAIGMSGAYQTLVQPFTQQYQLNNVQRASIQRLQQQVATPTTTTSTTRPNQTIRNTGHQTRSLNYSHYYPTTSSTY
ncbi:MAG TPA: hypothetical protein VMF30_07225 [Pirellulales bacterium]|nr:hypothetical protein [Pirellulales bacterium]